MVDKVERPVEPSDAMESCALSAPRIPTLDGWRGVAILLVLFDHTESILWGRYLHPTGLHGVTIFFVLSGFLITSNLLQGPVDLRKFYVRRFFRLMPVAWIYFLTLFVIGWSTNVRTTSSSAVLACLFFYRNFVTPPFGITTVHFWSLSLEEQFYIVLPCLLVFAGVRSCRSIVAAGIIGVAVYRLMTWAHCNPLSSFVRADALLTGTLMAMFLQNPQIRSRAIQWSKWWAFPALALLIYCVARFTLLPPLIECVSIALLLTASIFHSKAFAARPLSTWVLSKLGIISYSIYVWHGIFVVLARAGGLKSFLFLGICLPLFAIESYLLIERPCNRIGHRLTRVSS